MWKKGGGWCDNVRNCVYRKKSRRGSSNYMEKQIQFTGILSDKAQANPGLFVFMLSIISKDLEETTSSIFNMFIQIFSTGIESSFVTVMVVPSVEIVRTRLSFVLEIIHFILFRENVQNSTFYKFIPKIAPKSTCFQNSTHFTREKKTKLL